MTRAEWERWQEYVEAVEEMMWPKTGPQKESESRLIAEKQKKDIEKKGGRRAYEKARRVLVKRLPRVERERKKRAKRLERVKKKIEKSLPSKWRRAKKRRERFGEAVRTVQRVRDRTRKRKREYLEDVVKGVRERRQGLIYEKRNREVIRIVMEKVSRGDLEWSIRKSLDEDGARAGKTKETVLLQTRADQRERRDGHVARERSYQKRVQQYIGAKKGTKKEEEASSAERRRRKMGRWESPSLSPPTRKRRGDVTTDGSESKGRKMRWGDGSSMKRALRRQDLALWTGKNMGD